MRDGRPRADRGAGRRRPRRRRDLHRRRRRPSRRARPSRSSRSGSRSWSSRRSPPASASSSPTSGSRDVAVMHSVADIAGINDDHRKGLPLGRRLHRRRGRRLPRRRSGAEARRRRPDRRRLDERQHDHGDGPRPGPAREGRLRGRHLPRQRRRRPRARGTSSSPAEAVAVLDYTTTELGAGLVGGLMDAGPTRMEAAGRQGIPQVLVPGCVDFITCGPLAEAEQRIPRPGDVRPQPRADPGPAARRRDGGARARSSPPRRTSPPARPPSWCRRRGSRSPTSRAARSGTPRPTRPSSSALRRQPRLPDPRPGDRRPHQRPALRRRRRRRAAGPGRRRPRRAGGGLGMSRTRPWGIVSTAGDPRRDAARLRRVRRGGPAGDRQPRPVPGRRLRRRARDPDRLRLLRGAARGRLDRVRLHRPPQLAPRRVGAGGDRGRQARPLREAADPDRRGGAARCSSSPRSAASS